MTAATPQGRGLLRAVYFEYTGRTAMTVLGPISGRRYRFRWGGDTVAVDPVDQRSLSRVPHLRLVRQL